MIATVLTKRNLAQRLRRELGSFLREELPQAARELRESRQQLSAAIEALGTNATPELRAASERVSRTIGQIEDAIRTVKDMHYSITEAEQGTENAQ